MTENFIHSALKSKVRFLSKHILIDEFQWVNDPKFWDKFGSKKFSFNNGVWKSANHSNNSTSGIQHRFDKFRKISFTYKTSTEAGFDYLYVRINGKTVLKASWYRDWTHFEYDANNVIEDCLVEIFYSKDGSIARGSDTVWLKDLRIITTPKPTLVDLGWSLVHQFASKDGKTAYPTIKTINGKLESINSAEKLKAAGISYYLSTINTSNSHLEEHYMQAFYNNTPHGYIEFPLPDGYNTVMVEYGNWYTLMGTYVHLYIGGKEVQTLGPAHGAATYVGPYKSGDTLKITEDGIFYVKAIWVKKQ